MRAGTSAGMVGNEAALLLEPVRRGRLARIGKAHAIRRGEGGCLLPHALARGDVDGMGIKHSGRAKSCLVAIFLSTIPACGSGSLRQVRGTTYELSSLETSVAD